MTRPLHEKCWNQHRSTGYITNQPDAPPIAKGRAHAAVVVCDDPECRRLAQGWVERRTKEPAVFCTFSVAAS